MTRVLFRVEMKVFDVSVHILEPGLFVTNITNSKNIVAGWLDLWKKQPQHIKDEYGQAYVDGCKCTRSVVRSAADIWNGEAGIQIF